MAGSETQPAPTHRRPRLTLGLNVMLAVGAAAGVTALVLEYGGFALSATTRDVLHVVQFAVVGVFVLDRVARWMLARDRWAHLKRNWVDFAVIGAALAAAALAAGLRRQLASVGALYVIISQAYLLISLVLHAINANLAAAESGIRPPLLLVGSFAFLCLAGSGLLMLPAALSEAARLSKWYYQDALFTAVSATCVTGLVVVDTGQHFSPFGQGVILVLIQLGGLGIMLFGTAFAYLVGKSLSVRGESAMGEMLATEKVGQLRRLAKFVVLATLLIEAIGAVMLYPMFAAGQADGVAPSAAKAVWDSVFHSISAFCNAGFSLYKNNLMEGAGTGWSQPLRAHWQVYGVFGPLIVLGGLGFPVLQDCWQFLRNVAVRLWHRSRATVAVGLHNAPRPVLSLHSKLVLTTTLVLIVGGAVMLLLLEPPAVTDRARGQDSPEIAPKHRGDWAGQGQAQRWGGALFQSITARTAGFNTIDMDELSSAGKFLMCTLMSIGGSPASTAGGMKTITFAVLLLAVWSILRRRDEVEVHKRTLPLALVRRVAALAVLYGLLVWVTTALLAVLMRSARRPEKFVDLLFEACSACGTVGLSTGVTPRLCLSAKCVVIAAMYIGRLGPLTLILAIAGSAPPVKYSYPKAQITIG